MNSQTDNFLSILKKYSKADVLIKYQNRVNKLNLDINNPYVLMVLPLADVFEIKSDRGLFALKNDLEFFFESEICLLGEQYISYNLKYDKYNIDPLCEKRLSIKELQAIVLNADFESFCSNILFNYNLYFNPDNKNEVKKAIKNIIFLGGLKHSN